MSTENLEWLVFNALHGDISGDNNDDLKIIVRANAEYYQLKNENHTLHSDYAALLARVARLEEALKRGVELHENCDADTCMCGESMWHALSDHKPTAMLQYYGDQWAGEARRALEEK